MVSYNRDQRIDIMKGFAILLVLLGHRFMTNTIEGVHHPASVIIYSFHMAFFFFISGYVNEKTKQLKRKGFKKFISDKIRTLILPFAVWTFICYISNGGESVIGYLSALNFYPNTGYWFLPILFLFFCFILIINKSLKLGGGIIILLLITIAVLIKQVFPIWYATYWASFLLGNIMANQPFAKIVTTDRFFGISSLVLIACWFLYPLENNQIGKVINLIFSFIIGLLSCISFYNFFNRVSLPKFLNLYFTEIGKYTLPLYLIPILILPHGIKINNEYLSGTSINLIILCVSVIHSLVSYALGRLIYEVPYLRYILFGKK